MENKDRNLQFWDFNSATPMTNMTFGEDKILSKNELEFINNKLYNRLSVFKASQCFPYLLEYYENFKTIQLQKEEKGMKDYYNAAVENLHNFTYCYEQENKK